MARQLSEDEALLVIQCAVRCRLSKRELRQLRAWHLEDQKWRLALKRRRQRIERLERELRHVENLPAVDVDRYASTARYGMRGIEAAVQTIQGFWRALLRARRRRKQRLQLQNKAAKVLQSFFKKYPKLRKQRLLKQKMQSQEATPKKHSASDKTRPRDETPWELPSVQVLTYVSRDEQVVRAMQSKVTAHLEAWKKAGGMQRPRSDEELQDLSQRAKSRFAEFQKGLSTSRKAYVARSQLRQEAAACYISLHNCHGLQELETDAELEACAKGQRSLVGIHDKEYAELVETAARSEHDKLLKELTSRGSTNAARRRA